MQTKLTIAAVAFGALVTGTVRTASAEPAWCKGGSFDDNYDLKDLSSKDPERAILTFAAAACAPNHEVEANKANIEKSRAAWGKRLGMTEGDWADVIAWMATDEGRNIRFEFSTKDVAQYTPLDQYKAIADGVPSGTGGGGTFEDPIYITDVFGDGISEVARFAYIDECLKAETSVTSSAPPASTWALCQADIDAFDMAKFNEQLRADTAHKGDIKMVLRFRTMDLKKRLEDHKAAVETAWKLDPVYKKMFEVAAAARTEWASGMGKETELLGLVTRMNSAHWAGSRKQFEGCEEPTAAALQTAVAKLPASTWKGMHDVRDDPFGGFAKESGPVLMDNPQVSLAVEAYIICRPAGGTAAWLAAYARSAPAFRGPRTMGFARMLSEKLTLDDMTERVYWPKTGRPYNHNGGTSGSAGGVVAKTKMEDGVLVVELERLIVKRNECVESHRGKRISRINLDGSIDYELICDKMGTVEYDETWSDFKIQKEFAPLLKKGVKFSAVNGPGGMDVIAIWPNKKTDVPTWLVGAKVK